MSIRKKDSQSYFLTSGDPQTCPRSKIFATLYSVLHNIFDLVCNMTMFVQNGPLIRAFVVDEGIIEASRSRAFMLEQFVLLVELGAIYSSGQNQLI